LWVEFPVTGHWGTVTSCDPGAIWKTCWMSCCASTGSGSGPAPGRALESRTCPCGPTAAPAGGMEPMRSKLAELALPDRAEVEVFRNGPPAQAVPTILGAGCGTAAVTHLRRLACARGRPANPRPAPAGEPEQPIPQPTTPRPAISDDGLASPPAAPPFTPAEPASQRSPTSRPPAPPLPAASAPRPQERNRSETGRAGLRGRARIVTMSALVVALVAGPGFEPG
jgi:hypothetical protein